MDLLYFIKAVYKKRVIIGLCVIIAMIAAFLFTRQEKKSYKSTAQLATGFTMNDLVSLSDRASDLYGSELKFSNVIETINSPQVLNLLSCSLILHDLNNPKEAFRNYSPRELDKNGFSNSVIEKGKKVFGNKLQQMKMLSSFSPQEKLLLKLLDFYGYDEQTLSKMINVHRLNRTDFINIDCSSDNPLLSAYIVNTLCKEFNRFYASFLSQRSAVNIQMLDTLKEKKLQVLNSKQDALRQALQGTNTDLSETSTSLIAQYQSRLISLRSELTTAQLSLNAVNKQLTNIGGGDKTINSNNNDIINLNNQINSLTAKYIDGGSKDKTLAGQISALKLELQKKYSDASKSGVQTSRGDLIQKQSDLQVQIEAAKSDIAYLQKTIASLSGNVRNNAGRDIMIQALQKEVERATADYNNINDKYSMAMNDFSQSTNFKQILFGQPSLTPERSKRLIIIIMAGAFGGSIAVVVIVLLLYFDVSIKAPSSFQKQTGINILSSTNKIDLKKNDVMTIINASSVTDKTNKRNRTNIFREHVRKLRQSLDDLYHPIILFTSTEHGQGKTTLIQALAYSMSLSKKKVLLIDTNFCNNDLTVQTKAKPILESFSVIGQLSDADLDTAITHTDIEYIDVIGCDGGDYTPQEILPKGNLLEHLEEIKKRYDFILLEAAPMNSYTDTWELIKYVDSVISIFSAEAVIKPLDLDAIDYLRTLNGKYRGAILNKVELTNMES